MPPPPRAVPLFTAYVTGDNLFPEDLHDQNKHIRDAGFYYMVAAEAINTDGGDPPLALYLLTDGRVGLGDANDSVKNTLFGFATTGQNIAVGERVEVVSIQGAKVRGFSGLTIGTEYFVTDDATGSITTTDTGIPAGIAVDEDTLELKKIFTTAAVNVQTFTGDGTWTKPNVGSKVLVQLWGGGGGGGKAQAGASFTSAGAGGGGSYIQVWFDITDLGDTEAVVVGAGGVEQTAGGNSTFDIATAYGGGAGPNKQDVSSGTGGGGGGSIEKGADGGAAGGVGGNIGGGASDTIANADSGGGGGGKTSGGATTGKQAFRGGGGGGGGQTSGGKNGGNSVQGGGGGGGGGSGGGSGGISLQAGNGGAGGAGDQDGFAGTAPSGGGGGASRSSNLGTNNGGVGAEGKVVVITFT